MTDALVRIAVYDLDRTVLRKPTFTLFLLWAAVREAPWRLLLLPLLAALMIGYALRLYGRDRFKPAAHSRNSVKVGLRRMVRSRS